MTPVKIPSKTYSPQNPPKNKNKATGGDRVREADRAADRAARAARRESDRVEADHVEADREAHEARAAQREADRAEADREAPAREADRVEVDRAQHEADRAEADREARQREADRAEADRYERLPARYPRRTLTGLQREPKREIVGTNGGVGRPASPTTPTPSEIKSPARLRQERWPLLGPRKRFPPAPPRAFHRDRRQGCWRWIWTSCRWRETTGVRAWAHATKLAEQRTRRRPSRRVERWPHQPRKRFHPARSFLRTDRGRRRELRAREARRKAHREVDRDGVARRKAHRAQAHLEARRARREGEAHR